ncbi:vWA domain-containing protein [Planktothricoides raciborskii]|uniref:VWA domain-containing protein n=1 Tax=Planktothricoides raciborskii FACHB-1370 TaxID=2949576 RepID=A0ABR8EC01_9CYAN|nr:VWA domain-containing protein [Planktothricoides raciborskii]MBD2543688.1 VWA domain-containing protein [Planktothricoides raciborskii FACHB-1370]MBD2582419.1 VWA domain-containing protein [Planktothricoides raciborskii FACHB-1261]
MPIGNNADFATNQEPRCPVVLLLDNSGSMSGQPIQQLNQGVAVFKQSLDQDPLAKLRVEVAIVSFGPVRMCQDFVTIDQFVPPQLKAEELTPMGEAINYALDLLENRKTDYRNNGILFYRPWVFLITDGSPTDTWQPAAQRVRQGENDKKFSFFAVGVQGADMGILSQIATRSPLLLNGLDFKSMFLWLSASLTQVSHSQPGANTMIQTPPVGWGQVAT